MNLVNLGPAAFAFGLLGLAGLLALLQILRVRHRPQRVVTTLFWREAVEESQARVFRKRFRHPWAYLLLLLIVGLIWLGFADPRPSSSSDRETLLLLDASAGMAREGDFQDARDALLDHLNALPDDRRRVLLCGATVRQILAPGEAASLAEARLEGLAPEPALSSVEDALRLQLTASDATGIDAVIFGRASVSKALVDEAGERLALSRASGAASSAKNRGIVALGARPARSGAFDRVDLLISSAGSAGDESLVIELEGQTLATPTYREDARGRHYELFDLPASGGRVVARLDGSDALASDDEAAFRLPLRRPLAVAVAPGLSARFGPLIDADPGTRRVEPAEADLLIRRQGSAFASDSLPALELVDPSAQTESILLQHADEKDSADALVASLAALGLDEIDATGLATEMRRPISVGAAPGPRRGLFLHADLLSPEYNFVHARAFPLFVARALRWLADWREAPLFAGVGDEIVDPEGTAYWRQADGSAALGADRGRVHPLRAGRFEDEGGRSFSAALLDPFSSAGQSPLPSAELDEASRPRLASSPLRWLLIIVLLLLTGEWFLLRRGRMP